MSIQQVLAAGRVRLNRDRPPAWQSQLHGSELAWAVAFVVLARVLYRMGLRRYSAFGG